jgi:hypothetical protein
MVASEVGELVRRRRRFREQQDPMEFSRSIFDPMRCRPLKIRFRNGSVANASDKHRPAPVRAYQVWCTGSRSIPTQSKLLSRPGRVCA